MHASRNAKRRRTVAAALMIAALAAVLTGCSGAPSTGQSSTAPATATPDVSTPPMGWNSWNHFGCSVTEADVKAAADAIVADGLLAAGYQYVNVDDCWQAPTRDAEGRLRADPTRFPDGIAALAAYVHREGLKFGIYAAPGAETCAERYQGYPGRIGSLGHVEQDARTFAEWGVDYLKYDWCAADREGVGHEQAFAQMRAALKATGRPIVFSIHDKPEQPVPAWRHWVSDLSRSTPDIEDSWNSVVSIVRATLPLERLRPPGFWNDPDMLEVGNGGLDENEERSHLALWAQLSAPLLMGCDPSTAPASSIRTLATSGVIDVDQDRLGAAPEVLASTSDELVLLKPLADGSRALTITNLASHARAVAVPAAALGLGDQPGADRTASGRVGVEDLWTGKTVELRPRLDVRLAEHATAMYRLPPS